MQELRSFSEDLAAKPMIVVATKMDSAQDPARVGVTAQTWRRSAGCPFLRSRASRGRY